MAARCSVCKRIGCSPRKHRMPYDAAHRRATAQLIILEPWCHNPIGCPHPDAGTPDNPLTGEHTVPRAKGNTGPPDTVLCLRCNSAKRDR